MDIKLKKILIPKIGFKFQGSVTYINHKELNIPLYIFLSCLFAYLLIY